MQAWRYPLLRFIRVGLAWAAPALASISSMAAPCPAPDHLTRVNGGSECLLIKTVGHPAEARTLYVLLHGNHTSGSPAVSQYPLAESLVAQGPAAMLAVALIRPGYNNADGNYSSGNAAGRGDNFTAENIDIVADAIARLKSFHRARRLVLVGHSGGAAMAGVILGRHAGLADAGLLVACPCDVPAWRAMQRRADFPWRSESAIRYVDRIPVTARVSIVVGAKDDITPSVLSVEYAVALRARGIATELSILPGIYHVAVIDAPAVVAEALRLGESRFRD